MARHWSSCSCASCPARARRCSSARSRRDCSSPVTEKPSGCTGGPMGPSCVGVAMRSLVSEARVSGPVVHRRFLRTHFLHGTAILNGTGFQKTSQDLFRNRMGTFLFACIALAFKDLNTHLPGLTSWGVPARSLPSPVVSSRTRATPLQAKVVFVPTRLRDENHLAHCPKPPMSSEPHRLNQASAYVSVFRTGQNGGHGPYYFPSPRGSRRDDHRHRRLRGDARQLP